MSTVTAKLVSEALSLTPSQRAFVAEKLIESLDVEDAPELSEAWKDELRRRCQEVDQGSVELREAEAVFAQAHALLQ